jgi:phosphoglycerol transferase MdoB-like AlkP superfamily enzyme
MQTNLDLNYSFISHTCRYVGVGMLSGSIVHMQTLGGSALKYLILMILGIILFTIGTFIEQKGKLDRKTALYLSVSIVVSLGTGMVSGSSQHFLDAPVVASILLAIGLCIAYISFGYRDFRQSMTIERVCIVLVVSALLGYGLVAIARILPESAQQHSH